MLAARDLAKSRSSEAVRIVPDAWDATTDGRLKDDDHSRERGQSCRFS
jgi:hypothetical protein